MNTAGGETDNKGDATMDFIQMAWVFFVKVNEGGKDGGELGKSGLGGYSSVHGYYLFGVAPQNFWGLKTNG